MNNTTQQIKIIKSSAQSVVQGTTENFTGEVEIKTLFAASDPSRTTGGAVTFEPGARTVWHTHPYGQTLVVTNGSGRVQQWGGMVEEIHKGDVIWFPAGVKHWHGAAPHTALTHIAIQEELKGKTVQWLEPVSDDQYNGQ